LKFDYICSSDCDFVGELPPTMTHQQIFHMTTNKQNH